jgi:GST-like protein
MAPGEGEAPALTLLGMGSPNVLKVVLMLEELERPYYFERCAVVRGGHRNARFAALNPAGKVPVLIDAAKDAAVPLALFESGAILIYLAEKSARFLPGESAARYAVLQWLMLQMASIGPIFGNAIHLKAFAENESYAVARFTNEMGRLLDTLERRLGGASLPRRRRLLDRGYGHVPVVGHDRALLSRIHQGACDRRLDGGHRSEVRRDPCRQG